MDDFVISNLHESRNEWCGRLVSIFTPLIHEGFQSIFDEAWKMCIENDEASKYLMTLLAALTIALVGVSITYLASVDVGTLMSGRAIVATHNNAPTTSRRL